MLRRPGLGCLALLLCPLLAQATPAPATAAEDPPSPPPARPVSDSVERVVGKMEKEREDPCRKARAEGVPCFPASTTVRDPMVSLREALRDPTPPTAPVPNRPPTQDEMKAYRPGPIAPTVPIVPLVTFDPGCVAKSALKGLKGKNDVYYLYWFRDVHGERVALYDRRLDATTFQGEVAFLGRFEGECEATAAYRRELRKLAPRPSQSPSPP